MSNKELINIGVLGIVLCLVFFVKITFLNLILPFLLILVLVFSKWSSGYKGMFFNDRPVLQLMSRALLYAAVIVALNLVLIPIVVKLTNAPINYGMFDSIKGNLGFLAGSLAVGWLVGGLLEETIFRAYFLTTFESLLPEKVGLVVGVVVSSLIFGYLHSYQGITGQISAGLLGFFLAIIYIKNGRNLWLNICTHGFVNTIGMVLLYFGIH